MSANERQVGGNHYVGATQPWDFSIDNKLNPISFIIVKYLTRWERTGKLQDLEKVEHYAQKLIEVVKEGRLTPSGGPLLRTSAQVKTLREEKALNIDRGPLPHPVMKHPLELQKEDEDEDEDEDDGEAFRRGREEALARERERIATENANAAKSVAS